MESSIAETTNRVIVNMSCVKYIDSTFLGQVIKYGKKSQKAGGDLKLVACEGCGDHPIWVLFELTRTSDIFSIFESVDEAIKSFANSEQTKYSPPGLHN
jgi:anti-anti-sigma factor